MVGMLVFDTAQNTIVYVNPLNKTKALGNTKGNTKLSIGKSKTNLDRPLPAFFPLKRPD